MMKKILLNPFFSIWNLYSRYKRRGHTLDNQPAAEICRRPILQPTVAPLHWSVYCTRNKPEHTGGRLQNRMHNIHQMIHLLPHSPYQLVQKIRRIRGGCVCAQKYNQASTQGLGREEKNAAQKRKRLTDKN